MRVTGMAFEKKIVTAQYEHELLRVECAVTESDDPNKALTNLIKFVQNRGCILDQVGDTTPAPQAPAAQTSTPPKAPKKTAAKPDPKKSEEEVKAETEAATTVEAEDEPKVNPDAQTTAAEGDAAPVVKEETTKAPKKSRIKGVNYDRANENHKKLLGEVYDKHFAGWRSKAGVYVEASKKMEGVAFLDPEGLVLQEFIDALKEIVGK